MCPLLLVQKLHETAVESFQEKCIQFYRCVHVEILSILELSFLEGICQFRE
jgi:hypothetical protein